MIADLLTKLPPEFREKLPDQLGGVRDRVHRSESVSYAFEQTLLLSNRVGVEYISRCRCWAARLTFETDRTRGFEFGLSYRILGLGDDTVRPFQGG